ncbi:MAG: hypothetical protein GZ086_14320 [Gelidibacter sp.]|nr:hypothetical protein [Gelidibacter sp.]
MAEINANDLSKAQKKASQKVVKLNEALGLTYYVVRNDNLIAIKNGDSKVIRKAQFGSRTVKVKRIKLNNEQ